MKAIQVSSFGAPEVLRVAELPDPAPGPGEVAVDVTHAASASISSSTLSAVPSGPPASICSRRGDACS